MTLLELQRRMTEDVMRPLTPDYQMQATTADGLSTGALVSTYIRPNDRLSSFERLEIYNRQYWFRVIDAVSEDFPALRAVLGTDQFDELILAYLRDNPSTSFTLRNLGSKMPEWIRLHPELTGEIHDLAVDVVDLEWAYVEAFDLGALPPLDVTNQTGFDPGSPLRLQPHLQLLDLRYPVDELVVAVHRETPSSDIMSNAISERNREERGALPPMDPREIRLAVHRFENSVYYRRVDKETFLLLSALRAGETLGKAFDLAFEGSDLSVEEQMEKIRDCFAHAAQVGWFCTAGQ
jgi:Putative DNA-binding domain